MRRHPPTKPRLPGATSWNGQRDRGTQARFRATVLRQAGHQCQYITADGYRCPATHRLEAHHSTTTTGIALCHKHHRTLDPHAR